MAICKNGIPEIRFVKEEKHFEMALKEEIINSIQKLNNLTKRWMCSRYKCNKIFRIVMNVIRTYNQHITFSKNMFP